LIREGGGSSVVAGGVALFCGAVDCAWHGGANHAVAQAKSAHNAKTKAMRTTCPPAAPRVVHLPATVPIRLLLPAASVRNPRARFSYNSVTFAQKSTRPVRARQSSHTMHQDGSIS
jgi:hypothetical protein